MCSARLCWSSAQRISEGLTCPVVLISPYWEQSFCLPSVMGNVKGSFSQRLCLAFFNRGNCVWWSWSFLFPYPFASLPDTPFLLPFCCLLGRKGDYFDVTLNISCPVFHLQNCSVSVSGSLLPTWCSANCLNRLCRSFAGVGEISEVRRWHKWQFLMTRHGGVM